MMLKEKQSNTLKPRKVISIRLRNGVALNGA